MAPASRAPLTAPCNRPPAFSYFQDVLQTSHGFPRPRPSRGRRGRTAPSAATASARAVLAFLLIHANEAGSAERLIDEVWGPESPKSAAASLQNYVSQLRKSLGPDVLYGDGRLCPARRPGRLRPRPLRAALGATPAGRRATGRRSCAQRSPSGAAGARGPRVRVVRAARDRAPRGGAARGARGAHRRGARARRAARALVELERWSTSTRCANGSAAS